MTNLHPSFAFRSLICLVCGGLLTAALSAVSPQEATKKEPVIYFADLVAVRAGYGGAGHRSSVTIRIEGYTSDEERQKYLEMIREKEDWLLRDTLEKVRGLGRITVEGEVGNELALVREQEAAGAKVITLVTARNMSFVQHRYGVRSTQYPFTYLQLLVDEEGKGQGTILGAVRARFNKEGVLEIQNYGLEPFQLFNVRRHAKR